MRLVWIHLPISAQLELLYWFNDVWGNWIFAAINSSQSLDFMVNRIDILLITKR